MRRSTIFAAVSSVLALASLSQAAFTISQAAAVGSVTGVNAPADPPRFAFNFRALNDVGGADGSNLQAVKLVFTGTGGTKVFFSTFQRTMPNPDPEGDPIPIPDTFGANPDNFDAGYTTILNRQASNLRIADGATTYVNNPGDADSPLTQDQATNGVSSFAADYAVLSAAASVPASTGVGARFARLVFNTATPSGTLLVTLAGETGPGVDYTFNIGVTTPPNVAPVVLPTAPTPVVFGSVVSNGKAFSVTVNATDVNATDALSLALGAINASDFIGTPTVAGGGVSPTSFTISGTVAYSTGNRVIVVPINVSDGHGGLTPSTFNLVVTPEPASLAALGGAAVMGLIRRRK